MRLRFVCNILAFVNEIFILPIAMSNKRSLGTLVSIFRPAKFPQNKKTAVSTDKMSGGRGKPRPFHQNQGRRAWLPAKSVKWWLNQATRRFTVSTLSQPTVSVTADRLDMAALGLVAILGEKLPAPVQRRMRALAKRGSRASLVCAGPACRLSKLHVKNPPYYFLGPSRRRCGGWLGHPRHVGDGCLPRL